MLGKQQPWNTKASLPFVSLLTTLIWKADANSRVGDTLLVLLVMTLEPWFDPHTFPRNRPTRAWVVSSWLILESTSLRDASIMTVPARLGAKVHFVQA